MSSLDQFAKEKLAALDAANLRREILDSTREEQIWIQRGARRLMSFCCNDYLNLSQHPTVKQAAIDAVARHGAGSGASRLVTGNHPLHRKLERRLAAFKKTEEALIFGSGYLANIGIIPALAGPGDAVFIDELAHACMFAGARLSRAEIFVFEHNRIGHVAELAARHRAQFGRIILATEGVFSMDGDLAPLPEFAELSRAHDLWLMTDDAHGFGVIGGGRGSSFAHATALEIPIQMGTLSKAVGSYGAYVCGSAALIELLKSRGRSVIYSTALPPASLAASLAALDIIEGDPDLVARPVLKARLFTDRLGLPPAVSPIVPILVGTPEAALARSAELEEKGFLVTPIRPPTVPEGTARLRITFSAAHPDDQILRLADAIRACS